MSTLSSLWNDLETIGRHPHTGGYRRFAWQDTDLLLREWFTACGEARGMDVVEDRNGNLWAWWMPAGWTGDPRDAFVTGSHLDSVPDGGAFDGPLGVVSGFAAVDRLRSEGIDIATPVAVTAFSDEEGARFGVACIGSQLSTGALDADHARVLRDYEGVTVAEAMRAAGRDPVHLGPDPDLSDRVGVFVELHIEQGRQLDLLDEPVAIASSIWPHGRWAFDFCGEANHAGTTRLSDRRDPMLAFAQTVLDARTAAERHDAVATFGKIEVAPNGANAIPSRVRGWLDARAADEATLTALVNQIGDAARTQGTVGEIDIEIHAESISPVVDFPTGVRDTLRTALDDEVPELPTQAGHDAGVLSAQVPSGMLFVRNPTGVSHSPDESAEMADCAHGVDALTAVMTRWATS